MSEAWNETRRSFTAAFGSEHLDASILLLPEIGMIEPDDPRFVQTVAATERELFRGKHVMRYMNEDDFGMPEAAFLTCRYWLIDAWWRLGRRDDARDLFMNSLAHRNRYGLLAEDIHPQTGELWGNFPQTYWMAGFVLTAMRLSRSWEDRYWRGLIFVSNRVTMPSADKSQRAGGLEVGARPRAQGYRERLVWLERRGRRG